MDTDSVPRIRRIWQHRHEPDRIHYVVTHRTGTRRIYADRGDPMFNILSEYLPEWKEVGPVRASANV